MFGYLTGYHSEGYCRFFNNWIPQSISIRRILQIIQYQDTSKYMIEMDTAILYNNRIPSKNTCTNMCEGYCVRCQTCKGYLLRAIEVLTQMDTWLSSFAAAGG